MRNYFKATWRNLFRNKAFSLINIMGLALGLTCSLLIMLWVNDEYEVDEFHKNKSQLYSVFERRFNNGKINAGYATKGLMADEMKRVFPEVQYASGNAWSHVSTFEANDKIIKEEGNFAGQDFFKMFSYSLLQGNAITALQTPVDIAISQKMAEDFFGSAAEAIGKTIRYQNKRSESNCCI